MRYYTVSNDDALPTCGITYICNHPVYDRCTLYKIGKVGLAVIQQRCGPDKRTWWDRIDASLVNDIYDQPGFIEYFDSKADKPVKGLYPTVSVRQIMWALRMKPLKREPWETVFDKSPI